MNILSKKGVISISVMISAGLLFSTSIQAASSKKTTAAEEKVAKKDNNKFPTGCRPVGFKQSLKVLSLYPGKEGALQSMCPSMGPTSQQPS